MGTGDEREPGANAFAAERPMPVAEAHRHRPGHLRDGDLGAQDIDVVAVDSSDTGVDAISMGAVADGRPGPVPAQPPACPG